MGIFAMIDLPVDKSEHLHFLGDVCRKKVGSLVVGSVPWLNPDDAAEESLTNTMIDSAVRAKHVKPFHQDILGCGVEGGVVRLICL
jgi:hypothetical protein